MPWKKIFGNKGEAIHIRYDALWKLHKYSKEHTLFYIYARFVFEISHMHFHFFPPFSLLFTKVPSDLCLFNNKPMGLRDVKMNKNHSMIDFNSTVECNV